MKKSSKITVYILSGLVCILIVASFLAGIYMVNYSLRPKLGPDQYGLAWNRWQTRMPDLKPWYDSLCTEGLFKDTTINFQGTDYFARYISARGGMARGTAVLCHGYTNNHISMMNLARMYRDSLGFNVLLFDQHYHGLSGGKALQMGWKDRFVARRWCEVAHDIWKDSKVLVCGVSMGGATVMMLSGERDNPDYIAAFVEDCGFCSVWDEFHQELKVRFGLPAFPVLYTSSLVCRIKYGWGFKEASSINQLRHSSAPMLFIHGDNDTFVPTADVYKNFDAKKEDYKKLWIAPNSEHANSYERNQAEYTAVVREFLNEIDF